MAFNVASETFEFYAPAKMKDDPRWVDVTLLFSADGVNRCVTELQSREELQPKLVEYMTRLVRLRSLYEREFHAEKITGQDKTIDVVVTSVLQTTAGKMIFGRYIEPAGESQRTPADGEVTAATPTASSAPPSSQTASFRRPRAVQQT